MVKAKNKPPFEDLTPAEEELLRACADGKPAAVRKHAPEGNVVRPELIQWLCRNSSDQKIVGSAGIWLDGAHVPKLLDLNNFVIAAPLFLDGCVIEELHLRAETRSISLRRTTIKKRVDAPWARIDGNLSMDDATIEGPFTLSSATLRDFSAERAKFLGSFDIDFSRLDGSFVADGATFEVTRERALTANGVKAGNWSMDQATVKGGMELNFAELSGTFSARKATFNKGDGDAIFAQGLKAANWFMHGATVEGEFDFNSALIGGSFACFGTRFNNPAGFAIRAHSAQIGSLFLREEPRNGLGKNRIAGSVSLVNTDLGYIDFGNTEIESRSGIAIRLDMARIGTRIETKQGFRAVGCIVLDNSVVPGRVNLRHASVSAHSDQHGVAPMPTTFDEVDRHLYWLHRNKAISAVDAKIGRLCLPSTTPLGIVDLARASLETLEDTREGWFLPLGQDPQAPGGRVYRTVSTEGGGTENVDLRHIVLDGTTYEHLEFPDGERTFTPEQPAGWFRRLFRRVARFWRKLFNTPGPRQPAELWQHRVSWLMGQSADDLTHRFNPQPWRQLARTLAAMGYEIDARHVAVRRRAAQRAVEHNLFRKGLSKILHTLADYGFNPWKTVLWAFGFVLLFGVLYAVDARCLLDCGIGGVNDFAAIAASFPPDATMTAADYPLMNPWFYSLDQFIPVLDLGIENYWRPHSPFVYALTVAEQFIGAFLVALAVTGFTGLLTRDEAA